MRLSLLFCSSLFFVSCLNSPVLFNEVKVDEQFFISVPDYLQPCSDLQKKARLQLQSVNNDLYLVVNQEKKSTFESLRLKYDLKKYRDQLLQQPYMSKISNPVVDTSLASKLIENSDTLLITNVTGEDTEGHSVFYKIGVVSSPEYYYQIILWTRGEKRSLEEAQMDTIVSSFREIRK